MNKRGIGLGPAIIFSVIILALYLIGTYFLLGYGKVNVTRTAKLDENQLEVNEALLELLNTKVEDLNIADLIVLREFDKLDIALKEKLPKDIGWSFRVYGPDFKNTLQSQPLYVLDNDVKFNEETAVIQDIKDYFGEDLKVYLSIRT